MRENRIEKVLSLMSSKKVDACLLKGMDNIFYLTGFRGSEGTLFITKGDIFLLTDFRYVTYAQEVTHGIRIIEVRDKRNVLGELCSQYKIERIGFWNKHPFSISNRQILIIHKISRVINRVSLRHRGDQ